MIRILELRMLGLRLWAFRVSAVGQGLLQGLRASGVLRGSWDLVTRVIIKVTTLITPLRVLITLLTKSHEPPSISGLSYRVGCDAL